MFECLQDSAKGKDDNTQQRERTGRVTLLRRRDVKGSKAHVEGPG